MLQENRSVSAAAGSGSVLAESNTKGMPFGRSVLV